MAELLAEDGDPALFVSGCMSNQGKFYDRFDAVVLLSAPAEVILDRIERRTTNDYGKTSGERTLRGYSRPISLAQFDRIGWMTTEDDLWPIVEHLEAISHAKVVPPTNARRLANLDRRSYDAGLHGAPGRHR